MPWWMGAAFGARTPIAELMSRLRVTALEAWFPSLNSDHDRGERRRKRTFSPSKKMKEYINYPAGGNHALSASYRRRDYAVGIVSRRRRSPWALDRGNLCCVMDRLATEHEPLLKPK